MLAIKELNIDSSEGGLGDIWMRLLAAYSISASTETMRIRILIPESLRSVARTAFADRIEIVDSFGNGALRFTHRGIRENFIGILTGQRFICPFVQQIAQRREGGKPIKWSKKLAYRLLDMAGRQYIPPITSLERYHGFMHMVAIPTLRSANWETFKAKAICDLKNLQMRLRRSICAEESPNNEIVVFPSGTSHQFMPPSFGVRILRDANYAFHENDTTAKMYEAVGLKIVYYKNVSELIKQGAKARTIVCTDSFPSHLWQTFGGNVVLIMTQQSASRVVHPGFSGRVIHSRAVCSPCLPTGRAQKCENNFTSCITWDYLTRKDFGIT